MRDIFVLVEHRNGEISDITYEILSGAAKLNDVSVNALLLADDDGLADKIKGYANKIYYFKHSLLKSFHSEYYQFALQPFIQEKKPYLMFAGHTSIGYELFPALSVGVNAPLIQDIIGIDIEKNPPVVIRQFYNGKLDAKVSFKENWGYMATVRQGTFPAENPGLQAEVEQITPEISEVDWKRFLGLVELPKGAVDITQADIVVAIGRGVKEETNIPVVEEFAKEIGGVLACSRPVVDAGWLPKERQVGSSGKTVKPKLYIALGISGAFQHIMGMKNSDLIIAVNKDPNAPIFGVADYGIVADMFQVLPPLKEKIKEMKG